jgi:hypothetical protein
MTMDDATMARTEAAFREVNEAIAATATRLQADEADFLCECADPSCVHRVTADLADYERVREDPTHFLVALGHDRSRLEHVIERKREYAVVEKAGRAVVRIVRRLDPRDRGNEGPATI